MIKELHTVLTRIVMLPQADQPKLLEKFFEAINRRGMRSLLPKLLALHLKGDLKKGARITLPRCASKEDAKDIMKVHETLLSPYVVEVLEDPRLLGGYLLEAPGIRIDASYRSALISMYKNITA